MVITTVIIIGNSNNSNTKKGNKVCVWSFTKSAQEIHLTEKEKKRKKKKKQYSEWEGFKRVLESTFRPGNLQFGTAGLIHTTQPYQSSHLDVNLELEWAQGVGGVWSFTHSENCYAPGRVFTCV